MSRRRERANEPTRQLNKQLVAVADTTKLRQERSRKNLHTAEIYIDLAKLVLGGVAIGNLFGDKQYWVYFSVGGFFMSLILFGIGNVYFNKGNKGVENMGLIVLFGLVTIAGVLYFIYDMRNQKRMEGGY